ncbi:hypothetical protein PV326_008011 [Microctonus aethiopoides]|nr:hypothetical protein PV326_008011 [Microctonus aethiopoides]
MMFQGSIVPEMTETNFVNGVSIIVSHGERNGEFVVEGCPWNSEYDRIFTSNSTTSILNNSFDECGLKRVPVVRWNITVLPR